MEKRSGEVETVGGGEKREVLEDDLFRTWTKGPMRNSPLGQGPLATEQQDEKPAGPRGDYIGDIWAEG